VHHRISRYLKSHDARLIWLNLLVLLSVSFLPYPTALMGEYGQQPFAVGFYAVCMGVTSLSLNLLWLYARHDPELVYADVPAQMRRYHPWRGIVAMIIFFVSVPIALLNPALAQGSWALIALVSPIVYRLTRDAG
jgi:uncharacterized membrane protein